MDSGQKLFISIISSYLSGINSDIEVTDSVISEVLPLAEGHKLLPAVFYSVKKYFKMSLSESCLTGFKKAAMLQLYAQIRRSEKFCEVYRKFCDSGVRPVTVKGITLREIYPEGELRPSGDEDIFIEEKDAEKVYSVLESSGFIKSECVEDNSVYTYRCETTGLKIEVHTSLFPPYPSHNAVFNSFFEKAFDSEYFMICGKSETMIRTLSPTDSLLFLILHCFKHFIYCGFGVRQLCDILVYIKTFGSKINFTELFSKLKEANAETFFKALLKLTGELFDFDFTEYLPENTSLDGIGTEKLEKDILSGGIYGNSTPERLHSSALTLKAADKSGKSSPVSAVFPSFSVMRERFTYLDRFPFLLPYAWSVRIFRYITAPKSGSSAAESLEIGKERIQMLKEYGIIK